MAIIKQIYYLFSTYTDSTERKIGSFFKSLNEDDSSREVSQRLIKLMQLDLVKINLLSEQKYKGYKYLTKSKRRFLYQNADLISSDFNDFLKSHEPREDDILAEIRATNPSTSGYIAYRDQLIYLKSIMDYLSPNNGKYGYRESSTFGELLKDPKSNTMLGDCNQIVTLYIYLYSKKFDINNLQLKTYPGHVALHFHGIDIEATNGEFKNYQHDGQRIIPVQEIVSINLLDTTDHYYKTHKIDPKSQLESARLALLVSSERQVTIKNLEIAYHNTINSLLKENDYDMALKYAKQSKDLSLIQTVGYNGAIYFIDQKNYGTAEKFAQYSSKKSELIRSIDHNRAVYYFSKGDFHKAIAQYKKLGGHQDDINKCYIGLFVNEQKKLGKIATVQDIKDNRSTINNMRHLAKMSGDSSLIDYVKQLTKHL